MQLQVQAERKITPSADCIRVIEMTTLPPKLSYAQNLEDVLLFRALGSISNGFYIDAGANDPVIDSVTKLFYDLGWTGINVEPSAQWFERLLAERSRDQNINIALNDRPGDLIFYELPDSGLSTTSKRFAENAAAQGFEKIERVVHADTLANICDRYAAPVIHFLKIDVEGAEANVLKGADFNRFRPWIVLVEATEPLSITPSHAAWESWLLDAGYDFVLFDNLNRFYVAREHAELKPFFSSPADRYIRAAHIAPPPPVVIEVLPEMIGWRQIATYAVKRIRHHLRR